MDAPSLVVASRRRFAAARCRSARSLALIVALVGCSPGFDELIGESRDAGDGVDGGERSDAGAGTDGAVTPPAMDGGSGGTGTTDGGADTGTPDTGTPDTGSPSDGAANECPQAADPTAVSAEVAELGAIAIPSVDQPRIGATALLGERVLWTFNFAATSSLATWSGQQGDLQTAPALQAPGPLLPLLPAGAVPSGYSPLIGGVVSESNGSALIYFVAESLTDRRGTGLARISVEARQAALIHPEGELFPQPVPPDGGAATPWMPLFWTGVFAHAESEGSYVYVYACNGDPDAPGEQPDGANAYPCRVARVRLEQAHDGAAYEYWNGRGWVGDIGSARVAINLVPGRLSVSYNRYLQKFLAVNSGFANDVALRWGDRPEGPWYDLDRFDTSVATGGLGFTFDAKEQLALRDPCHRVVYVTYLLPVRTTDNSGNTVDVFETRLVRVELD